MCLAIPARIELLGDGRAALVDFGGVRKRISLACLTMSKSVTT